MRIFLDSGHGKAFTQAFRGPSQTFIGLSRSFRGPSQTFKEPVKSQPAPVRPLLRLHRRVNTELEWIRVGNGNRWPFLFTDFATALDASCISIGGCVRPFVGPSICVSHIRNGVFNGRFGIFIIGEPHLLVVHLALFPYYRTIHIKFDTVSIQKPWKCSITSPSIKRGISASEWTI